MVHIRATDIEFPLTTDATSSTAGALLVTGGVAVAKKIYAGDRIHVQTGRGSTAYRIENTTDSNTWSLIPQEDYLVLDHSKSLTTWHTDGSVKVGTNIGAAVTNWDYDFQVFSSDETLARLYRSTSTQGNRVALAFGANNSAAAVTTYAEIRMRIRTNTASSEDGSIEFRVLRDGSWSEAINIEALLDTVSISADYKFVVSNTTEASSGTGAIDVAGGIHADKSIHASITVAAGDAAGFDINKPVSGRANLGATASANPGSTFYITATPSASFGIVQSLYVQGSIVTYTTAGTTDGQYSLNIDAPTTVSSTRTLNHLATVRIGAESSDGGGAATNNMGALWVRTGGITVGNLPTGNTKGTGTINVSADIYKNNSAYTNPDYVFEFAFTGNIEKFILNDGARAYLAAGGLGTLVDVELYARRELRLPHLGSSVEGVGIFERADSVLLHMEQVYLFLFDHERRIKDLERELEGLKQAA